jgi:hypothetical protein
LRKKRFINKSKNVHNIELEANYYEIINENDQNYEEVIDNEIYDHDIGVYVEINYDELDFEKNKTVENTEILG